MPGSTGTARAPTALHPGAHENVYGRCLVGLEIPFLPLPKGWLLIPSFGRREGKGKCDQKSIWKHAALCLWSPRFKTFLFFRGQANCSLATGGGGGGGDDDFYVPRIRAWACVSCFLELCKILKAGFSPHMCTESFPNPLLSRLVKAGGEGNAGS